MKSGFVFGCLYTAATIMDLNLLACMLKHALLVCGCSRNEAKMGEICKRFLRRRLDVCALSETKLKGKGEVIFGEVVGIMSGVIGRRMKVGVARLLSWWLLRCRGMEGVVQANVG